MVVRLHNGLDILTREHEESFSSFLGGVESVHASSDMTARAFSESVSVEGITLREAAVVYASLEKKDGNNILSFESSKRGTEKRVPLWNQLPKGVVS